MQNGVRCCKEERVMNWKIKKLTGGQTDQGQISALREILSSQRLMFLIATLQRFYESTHLFWEECQTLEGGHAPTGNPPVFTGKASEGLSARCL